MHSEARNSTPYAARSLEGAMQSSLLGRRIEMHDRTGSTNDLARQAAQRGEAEGLVIVAEEQSSGRGRLGRVWVAPHGCCVLCSVLLRPRLPVERAFYLTIAASLAIHRACAELIAGNEGPVAGIPALTIKWPNDVMLNGRKVAGVLCESELRGREWAYCIVGFGINANLEPADLGDLAATATSLSIELGRAVDRARLLVNVLGQLEGLYLRLLNGEYMSVYEEWSNALETVGRSVSFTENGREWVGTATRVEADGALVVRLDNGEERRIFAGDITLRAPDPNGP